MRRLFASRLVWLLQRHDEQKSPTIIREAGENERSLSFGHAIATQKICMKSFFGETTLAGIFIVFFSGVIYRGDRKGRVSFDVTLLDYSFGGSQELLASPSLGKTLFIPGCSWPSSAGRFFLSDECDKNLSATWTLMSQRSLNLRFNKISEIERIRGRERSARDKPLRSLLDFPSRLLSRLILSFTSGLLLPSDAITVCSRFLDL